MTVPRLCKYWQALVIFLVALPVIVSAVPIKARDSEQKYVFAHHMVGNTYPYTIDDWKEDIALASASGIDAFALNVGSDSWQPGQVNNAYTAAQGTNFSLFISFDMTVLSCTSADDAAVLRNYTTTYAKHPNQFKYNNKVFASTFSGEKCTFGQGSVAQGWSSQYTGQLTGENAVFFVPSFFVDPSTFGTYADAMDGQLNWNGAWPITVTDNSLTSLLQATGAAVGQLFNTSSSPLTTKIGAVVQNLTSSLDSDDQYIAGLGNKLLITSVSPWFFTHYGKDSFNKNFVYVSDQLYPSRWESIVSDRDKFPMVEILTWNDYGESSYLGPIKGAQPNSQAWVDGFDHTSFLNLTKYFASAYKTGTYPSVTEDQIFLWARPHTKNATAKSDNVGKPDNADVLEDALFAVILASSEGDVTLSTKSLNKTVSVKAGLNQLSLPLQVGDTMSASLSRDNRVVLQVAPNNYTFQGSPETYNFNFYSVSSGGNTTSQ